MVVKQRITTTTGVVKWKALLCHSQSWEQARDALRRWRQGGKINE